MPRPLLRVAIIEWITGGGCLGEPLPPGLAAEGRLMADGLAGELVEGGCGVMLCRDPRAGPVQHGVETFPVQGPRPPWRLWERALAGCDLFWPIAPETGGALEALARLGRRHGGAVVASDSASLRITASKRRTSHVLRQAGLPAVETVPAGAPWPASAAGWVVKPDDGAGALGVRRVRGRCALPEEEAAGLVVQPWLPGAPSSLSLLCAAGKARLLACNRQLVRERPDGSLAFEGVEVGGAEERRVVLEPLAMAIAAALPGLFGPVGVDLVDGPQGPVVLEINPRLTTAWVGLAAALGRPPGPLVLDLLRRGLDAVPPLRPCRVVPVLPERSHG
ncbi:ATP-grasp domain-containing protein [Marinimicrococcus flavescens]|uniref:ATP-grasp domain-containing protein n=1 Tax=Marinimicrococcus flavescens TaxID=3031815 RepID=A0AAP3UYN2_9PROT|nr:ATP-grasp domain-containing protein [Marinimicrococcus flavescens]